MKTITDFNDPESCHVQDREWASIGAVLGRCSPDHHEALLLWSLDAIVDLYEQSPAVKARQRNAARTAVDEARTLLETRAFEVTYPTDTNLIDVCPTLAEDLQPPARCLEVIAGIAVNIGRLDPLTLALAAAHALAGLSEHAAWATQLPAASVPITPVDVLASALGLYPGVEFHTVATAYAELATLNTLHAVVAAIADDRAIEDDRILVTQFLDAVLRWADRELPPEAQISCGLAAEWFENQGPRYWRDGHDVTQMATEYVVALGLSADTNDSPSLIADWFDAYDE